VTTDDPVVGDGAGRRRLAVEGARIAAMWAGVVPQQPPMIRAPVSSSRGTIDPNHGGSAA
jgi:hypothetical protein